MNWKLLSAITLGLLLVGLAFWTSTGAEKKSHKLTSISPQKMADALHAVIAADRHVYAEIVVQRLARDKPKLAADENWSEKECLPVPAQMLRMAGVRIQKKGAEFSYTLRSLSPINSSHGPQTEVEQVGLEHVRRHPQEPFYQEELLGGRSYFTAIYPDVATLPSCVVCHNQHPASPRRDFKLGDVMGAIVVRIPLEF